MNQKSKKKKNLHSQFPDKKNTEDKDQAFDSKIFPDFKTSTIKQKVQFNPKEIL